MDLTSLLRRLNRTPQRLSWLLGFAATILMTGLGLLTWTLHKETQEHITQQQMIETELRHIHDVTLVTTQHIHQTLQAMTLRSDSRLQADLDELLDRLQLRTHLATLKLAGTTGTAPYDSTLLEVGLIHMNLEKLYLLLESIQTLPGPIAVQSIQWHQVASPSRATGDLAAANITLMLSARKPLPLPTDKP